MCGPHNAGRNQRSRKQAQTVAKRDREDVAVLMHREDPDALARGAGGVSKGNPLLAVASLRGRIAVVLLVVGPLALLGLILYALR